MPGSDVSVDFWVHEVKSRSRLGTTVTGKCFEGSLALGDVLTRVISGDIELDVALRVEEVSLYGTLVGIAKTAIAVQLVLRGNGEEALASNSHLRGG